MTDTDKNYVSIKTEELEGRALRYAVAVAVGQKIHMSPLGMYLTKDDEGWTVDWEPDRDWSQIGPLCQRCGVSFQVEPDRHVFAWIGSGPKARLWGGATHQMAACRAIAAAHHGDYADVPRELVEET